MPAKLNCFNNQTGQEDETEGLEREGLGGKMVEGEVEGGGCE
jgi:hypothetical protein